MKKFIFVAVCTLVSVAQAQLRFDIKLLPDNDTYVVSVLPEKTWSAPMNKLGAVQFVLAYDSDKEFNPIITSLVPGATWVNNALVENPVGAVGKSFVCITIVEKAFGGLVLENGVSVPIMTIKNASDACAGVVELLSNDDPRIVAARQAGMNLTQSFTVLGAGGNAFTGFVNSQALCLNTSVIDDPNTSPAEVFLTYPNPAYDRVNVRWKLRSANLLVDGLAVAFFDMHGREIERKAIPAQTEAGELEVMTHLWSNGAYVARLMVNDKPYSPASAFAVIH